MGDAVNQPASSHASARSASCSASSQRPTRNGRCAASASSNARWPVPSPSDSAGLGAVEREPRGRVDPTRLVEAVAQVDVGASDVVEQPQLQRDRERLAQGTPHPPRARRDPRAGTQRVERLPLLGASADRASDDERLLAARDRITSAAAEHEQLGLAGNYPRTFGAGRIGRQQATASR